MYSLYQHGTFIADKVRLDAYRRALREAVRSDSVVLDLGAGTGIFALLACQLGARRVYGIEPDALILMARDLAAANGYADRTEFFQALSTRVNLPEQADVIVSDIRGALPLYRKAIPTLIDARRRFLAPGGILIPRSDTLWGAVVANSQLYRRYLGVWEGRKFGLNLAAARELAVNQWHGCRMGPDKLLVSPQCWGRLDYTRIESPNLTGELTWEIDRPGTAHGLLIWFDAEIAPGLGFSNGPGGPNLIYGQVFFPWPQPVALAPGDLVMVSLAAHLVGEDYFWKWDSRIQESGREKCGKADWRQSTFFGVPLSRAMLEPMSPDHLPELNEEGLIERFILERMDGQSSLGEIAQRVAAEFPRRFPRASEALERVQEVTQQYSR